MGNRGNLLGTKAITGRLLVQHPPTFHGRCCCCSDLLISLLKHGGVEKPQNHRDGNNNHLCDYGKNSHIYHLEFFISIPLKAFMKAKPIFSEL